MGEKEGTAAIVFDLEKRQNFIVAQPCLWVLVLPFLVFRFPGFDHMFVKGLCPQLVCGRPFCHLGIGPPLHLGKGFVLVSNYTQASETANREFHGFETGEKLLWFTKPNTYTHFKIFTRESMGLKEEIQTVSKAMNYVDRDFYWILGGSAPLNLLSFSKGS